MCLTTGDCDWSWLISHNLVDGSIVTVEATWRCFLSSDYVSVVYHSITRTWYQLHNRTQVMSHILLPHRNKIITMLLSPTANFSISAHQRQNYRIISTVTVINCCSVLSVCSLIQEIAIKHQLVSIVLCTWNDTAKHSFCSTSPIFWSYTWLCQSPQIIRNCLAALVEYPSFHPTKA